MVSLWLSAFERFHVPCLVELSLGFICGKTIFEHRVRWVTLHDATLTVSNDQRPCFQRSPLPLPVAVPEACRLAQIPAMGFQASSTALAPPLAVWSTRGQIFTAFSYWLLNSLLHWTFNSSSY
ncbi:hypothetical protein T08_981 [Trichinella sp. T8]|nr:hypothetical protein T08_981 [Trichinella sp. T8]